MNPHDPSTNRYVQHKIVEEKAKLGAALNHKDSHVYICGSADMANACLSALGQAGGQGIRSACRNVPTMPA